MQLINYSLGLESRNCEWSNHPRHIYSSHLRASVSPEIDTKFTVEMQGIIVIYNRVSMARLIIRDIAILTALSEYFDSSSLYAPINHILHLPSRGIGRDLNFRKIKFPTHRRTSSGQIFVSSAEMHFRKLINSRNL